MTRKQLDLSLARITPEQRCLMLALVQQDRTIHRHRALRAFVAFCAPSCLPPSPWELSQPPLTAAPCGREE